jgi:hypothetical protein
VNGDPAAHNAHVAKPKGGVQTRGRSCCELGVPWLLNFRGITLLHHEHHQSIRDVLWVGCRRCLPKHSFSCDTLFAAVLFALPSPQQTCPHRHTLERQSLQAEFRGGPQVCTLTASHRSAAVSGRPSSRCNDGWRCVREIVAGNIFVDVNIHARRWTHRHALGIHHTRDGLHSVSIARKFLPPTSAAHVKCISAHMKRALWAGALCAQLHSCMTVA